MVTQRQPEWVSGEIGAGSRTLRAFVTYRQLVRLSPIFTVSITEFRSARQNSELGDGDSLPGGRLPPPASAINSREGGESAALDLNGVSVEPASRDDEAKSLSESAARPNWEREGGEIVAVIILLASVRLVERYDDDLAS